MAYFREGKIKEARESLERAVSLNSQNYLAHYYYAFALSRTTPDAQDVSYYSPEMAAKIREHLQKAIELRPDFPESYRLLGFVSLVTGDNLDGAITSLKKVLSVSPGRHDFSFVLAQLYARTGDYKQARQLLEQIARSNTEDQLKQMSERMLQQVQSMEENNARFEDAKKSAGTRPGGPPAMVTISSDPSGAPIAPSSPARTTPPAPADPSTYLREVLRAPGEGETQVQATLLRIECDAKGIVFVVQTASGMLRLRTASFDEVEITTYDTSVKGDITCGERKPANTVVVDYVPNTDKRLKADGTIKSIEFVPADFKLKP
jgi:predicted Zn-dependent protease